MGYSRQVGQLLTLLLIAVSCHAQKLPIRIGQNGAGITYATWSTTNKSSNITLSGGNLTMTGNAVASGRCIATVGQSSGKKYFEFTYGNENTGTERIGIGTAVPTSGDAARLGLAIPAVSYRQSGAIAYCVLYNLGAGYLTSGTGCVKTAGTVVSFATNLDSLKTRIYVNGALKATISSLPSGTWYPTCGSDGQSGSGTANFGASTWAYDPSTLIELSGYTGYTN